MFPSHYPPALQFGIPANMQPHVRVSSQLPERYLKYQIPVPAETRFIEAPFGSYITQEIRDDEWSISWQQCFIRERVRLRPSAAHPMLVMYCILKGNVPCRLQGQGKLMLIEKEYGVYYIPSQSQNFADLKTGQYEMICISFAPSFFSQFISRHPSFEDIHQQLIRQGRKGTMLPAIRMDGPDLKILSQIRNYSSDEEARKEFLREKLNELLTLYFDALTPKYLQNGEMTSKLKQVCAYIQEHYHQSLSIADLSRLSGMHINTFERAFKELLGTSPRGYIEHLRMKKAALLLLQTSLSIKDISSNTGYSGANYFTAVFRKRYRCSPREYRKNRLS
jgi:AraC-like DNA-binding protein